MNNRHHPSLGELWHNKEPVFAVGAFYNSLLSVHIQPQIILITKISEQGYVEFIGKNQQIYVKTLQLFAIDFTPLLP